MGQETCQYTLRLLLPSTDKHQSTSRHNDRLSHITGGSCRKYHFCRDKTRQRRVCRDKTRLLSRQKYACFNFCRDKIFLSRQNFSGDETFSRQTRAYFSHNKRSVLLRQTRAHIVLLVGDGTTVRKERFCDWSSGFAKRTREEGEMFCYWPKRLQGAHRRLAVC